MLHFKVDACFSQIQGTKQTQGSTQTSVNVISNHLSGLNIASTTPSLRPIVNTNDVRIRKGGTHVPQSALIELSTRSEHLVDHMRWGETYPQLFLSQIPNIYIGVHTYGEFTRIIKHGLDDPELKEINAGAQDNFRRLRRVLQDIQSLVREHGQRGRLSLVYQNGTMRVYQRKESISCLPDDILRRFEN